MKIKLRQPDVNESYTDFKVYYTNPESKQGEIYLRTKCNKNVGEKASEIIVKEREANGKFKGFIDFLTRVDLRLVNKKTLKVLFFQELLIH